MISSDIHLIGKYRGFDLFYDEREDLFYSDLQDRYEIKKEPKRGALRDLKRVIDETIKANAEFKPFQALHSSIGYENRGKLRIPSETPEVIKIIGVKKDGGLLIQKKKGKGTWEKAQLNKNSYDDPREGLFELNPHNENLMAEIAILEAEIELTKNAIDKKRKSFQPLDLSFINDFTTK